MSFRSVFDFNEHLNQYISEEFRNRPHLWKLKLKDVEEIYKHEHTTGLSPQIAEMDIG